MEQSITRVRHLDELAEALPQRASRLTRLFLARSSASLSRTEIGVLRAAVDAPERIGDLAAAEGVTQPAITLVVNRLAQRGWVHRIADPADGRAVLVQATTTGEQVYEQLRAEYRALLHEEMATLADDEVETLARAVDILDRLADSLNEGVQP